MPKVIVITGASGVGKTSLLNLLKPCLESNYELFHFDDIGVPTLEEMTNEHGSPSKWQEFATYRWIETIVRKSASKKVILEGQMNLDFIESGFRENMFEDYKIVLLDCSAKEMKRRLIEERQQPTLANEDMVNWLNYLRNQALEKSIEIIDTTIISKNELIELFLKTI